MRTIVAVVNNLPRGTKPSAVGAEFDKALCVQWQPPLKRERYTALTPGINLTRRWKNFLPTIDASSPGKGLKWRPVEQTAGRTV